MTVPVSKSPLEQVIYYQGRVDFFQEKYGMNFGEFRQRVADQSDKVLSRFGVIEKEKDDNDWDDAIDFIADYSNYLHQIRP